MIQGGTGFTLMQRCQGHRDSNIQSQRWLARSLSACRAPPNVKSQDPASSAQQHSELHNRGSSQQTHKREACNASLLPGSAMGMQQAESFTDCCGSQLLPIRWFSIFSVQDHLEIDSPASTLNCLCNGPCRKVNAYLCLCKHCWQLAQTVPAPMSLIVSVIGMSASANYSSKISISQQRRSCA